VTVLIHPFLLDIDIDIDESEIGVTLQK